jgi:predicted Fe-Mo cluster-binding NifX family protein
MKKRIKIAIPTDDGLIVRQKFAGSRAFVVATVKAGMIVHQELRWNLLSEILTSEHGFFYNLVDCDVIIINEIGNSHRDLFKVRKKEIVHTDHTKISKALDSMLEKNKLVQFA